MGLRTNLIISGIFVALLGFVYFYEIKGGEQRQVEAERSRQLLDFSDHEARRLTIDRGDTVAVLEKGEESWRLTSPVSTDADAQAVERYLRNLRETEIEGEPLQDSAAVAGDGGRLAAYGLERPRLKVLLELAGESPAVIDTLRFGDDTPPERFTYLQRSGDNPEVLRVRAWRFDNLDKGLFDLRDRRLLAFEEDEVRGLRLDRPGGLVELSRQGGGWRLDQPLAREADDDEVDDVLSRLRNAETSRIAFEQPTGAELSAAGLQEGSALAEVTLWIGEDRAEKRLQVGAEAGGGDRFARDSSRPHVFVVDSTVVNELLKQLPDLREKKLLALSEEEISRIELRRRGERVFTASRDSAGTWSLVDAAGREPKAWRFTSLVNDLNDLEAESFVQDGAADGSLPLAPFGLDSPRLSVRVDLTGDRTLEVRVGSTTGDGQAYAMRADLATVVTLEEDSVEDLDLSLDDVSNPMEEASEAVEPADG